ncbi:hypothetical protein BHE74_00036833 [Ensete ventricosum]|nr:hypothetical protein GW17_00017691 [Ensete ventricosum]RWW56467.1 hypothetical protein BHE74_00036833 [Ensete ventricosum]RZS01547.1 hypothetical protein BHM03_00031414 [Ensete ventricosum]
MKRTSGGESNSRGDGRGKARRWGKGRWIDRGRWAVRLKAEGRAKGSYVRSSTWRVSIGASEEGAIPLVRETWPAIVLFGIRSPDGPNRT